MPRFIQVWFACGFTGCEIRTEMLLVLDILGKTERNKLPPGWAHKQTFEEGQMFSSDHFCSHEVHCPSHAEAECKHVTGVTPIPLPEPVAPYTIVCCGHVGLAGWQCIRHEDHDGEHDFGEDLYGNRIDDQPQPAPEE